MRSRAIIVRLGQDINASRVARLQEVTMGVGASGGITIASLGIWVGLGMKEPTALWMERLGILEGTRLACDNLNRICGVCWTSTWVVLK